MIGSVDNGFTAQVEVAKYRGPAGVRVNDGMAEIAYFAGRSAYPPSMPRDILVDDRPVRAIATRPSDVKGMIVLIADWPDEPTP